MIRLLRNYETFHLLIPKIIEHFHYAHCSFFFVFIIFSKKKETKREKKICQVAEGFGRLNSLIGSLYVYVMKSSK